MDKKEYHIIGALIGLSIPLFTLTVFWWSAASIKLLHMADIPESTIRHLAIFGICLGILLDIFFVKKWIPKFYQLNTVSCSCIYLFFSIMAVAFFMGLPIGNLVWGMLAGVYIGRKNKLLNVKPNRMRSAAKNVGLFTAAVTGMEAFPIGILALRQESIIHRMNQLAGFDLFPVNRLVDIFLILILCGMLFLIQYVLTKKAVELSS